MKDEEILDFYRRLEKILHGRPYRILYLDVEDMASNLLPEKPYAPVNAPKVSVPECFCLHPADLL